MKIIASILAADFMDLGAEIRRVERAGAAGIHLDIMDGHFVDNIAFGVGFAKYIRKVTALPINAHLMVTNPIKYLDGLIAAGVDSVFVHTETSECIEEAATILHSAGKRLGVAVNLETPVSTVTKYRQYIDEALVISVPVGIGGQQFNPLAIDKIRAIRTDMGEEFDIYVDGGINARNIGEIIEAGATCPIIGTALFAAEDYVCQVQLLQQAARG